MRLDKTISISLKAVRGGQLSIVGSSVEFVYIDMMKFLHQVYHLIRTLK